MLLPLLCSLLNDGEAGSAEAPWPTQVAHHQAHEEGGAAFSGQDRGGSPAGQDMHVQGLGRADSIRQAWCQQCVPARTHTHTRIHKETCIMLVRMYYINQADSQGPL